MKKLKSKKGESLVETLVALLIITLAISFLTVSIEASGSLLNKAKKANKGFTYGGEPFSGTVSSEVFEARSVQAYEVKSDDGNTYYYYEP